MSLATAPMFATLAPTANPVTSPPAIARESLIRYAGSRAEQVDGLVDRALERDHHREVDAGAAVLVDTRLALGRGAGRRQGVDGRVVDERRGGLDTLREERLPDLLEPFGSGSPVSRAMFGNSER